MARRTRDALAPSRREHLSLLAAEDLERLEREGRLPGFAKSAATWAIDIAFWLLYGGVVAVIVYAIYFAPR
jgi:hypothetical protein